MHRRLIGAREAKNTLPGHHTIPASAELRHAVRSRRRCAAITPASTGTLPRSSSVATGGAAAHCAA